MVRDKKRYLGVWIFRENDLWYMEGSKQPFSSKNKVRKHIAKFLTELKSV